MTLISGLILFSAVINFIALTLIILGLAKPNCYSNNSEMFIFQFVMISWNMGTLLYMGITTAFLSLQLFTNSKNYYKYREEPEIKIKM